MGSIFNNTNCSGNLLTKHEFKSMAVYQFNSDGDMIKEFKSIAEAEKATQFSYHRIWQSIKDGWMIEKKWRFSKDPNFKARKRKPGGRLSEQIMMPDFSYQHREEEFLMNMF